jgi:hypothetical protein
MVLKQMIKDMGSSDTMTSYNYKSATAKDEVPDHMKTTDAFILHLVHEHHLLKVFFEDFDHYSEMVNQRVEKEPELLKEADLKEMIIVGCWSHD